MTTGTIGVVGVGRMGSAVLRRLCAAGRTVVASDVDPSRAAVATAAGARWCADVTEVAAHADVLVTLLPDGTVLDAAVPDAALAAAGAHSGGAAVWLDLTSGSPETTTRAAARAHAHGVPFVSAPIGGDPDDAAAGRLSFFVGGPAAAVGRVRPVLDDLADDGGVRIVGDDPAQAQVVKLLVNALWFAHATVTAEALQTAQRAGIEPAALLQLLVGTAGASAFSDRYLPRFLAGDDFATFGLDGVVTELRDVARMAAGLELPLLERSLGLHEAALAAFGPVPRELLAVRLLEERNGIPLRGQDDPDVSAR